MCSGGCSKERAQIKMFDGHIWSPYIYWAYQFLGKTQRSVGEYQCDQQQKDISIEMRPNPIIYAIYTDGVGSVVEQFG